MIQILNYQIHQSPPYQDIKQLINFIKVHNQHFFLTSKHIWASATIPHSINSPTSSPYKKTSRKNLKKMSRFPNSSSKFIPFQKITFAKQLIPITILTLTEIRSLLLSQKIKVWKSSKWMKNSAPKKPKYPAVSKVLLLASSVMGVRLPIKRRSRKSWYFLSPKVEKIFKNFYLP